MPGACPPGNSKASKRCAARPSAMRHPVVIGHRVGLRAQHRRQQAQVGALEHARVGLRRRGLGGREDDHVTGFGQHAPRHAGLGRIEVDAR
jgi:hypothetical protein